MNPKTTTNPIESAAGVFKGYKILAEKAIAQVSDENFFKLPEPESNSIAIIVKHMSGNMISRFTDFLTTDGEKEWRNRDGEFEMESMNKAELMAMWEKGWQCLFNAIEPLQQSDLGKIITIRNEEHSVLEALNRALAHLSYHVGQIVFLAKMYQSDKWQTLTIPKKRN